jgi:hypothetical protein
MRSNRLLLSVFVLSVVTLGCGKQESELPSPVTLPINGNWQLTGASCASRPQTIVSIPTGGMRLEINETTAREISVDKIDHVYMGAPTYAYVDINCKSIDTFTVSNIKETTFDLTLLKSECEGNCRPQDCVASEGDGSKVTVTYERKEEKTMILKQSVPGCTELSKSYDKK